MVRLKYILLCLLLSLTAVPCSSAQTSALWQAAPYATDTMAAGADMDGASWTCSRLQASLQAPYYFCDCYEGASSFRFPLAEQIVDTVWYTASVDDVRKGLTAYWFADCSVTLEVYALCSSKTPTIAMTIGRDQMREMDAATINQKIDEMGDVAGSLISALTPHIRVYPAGKGSGQVYVFPYDEGPHSTCEATLPVRTSMTYVSNHADDVYEWEPGRLPQSGSVFVQWKEAKNNPCQVWVTRGSCTGAEVARTTLADSAKLFFPDRTLIQSARKAGESLFFHFEHDAGKVGRIRFRTDPRFVPQITDTTVCQGMGLQLTDTLLTASTFYSNDTVWHKADSVYIKAYNLTVSAPVPQRDTVRVKAAQLPMVYRNQEYIAKGGYGDYDFTIHTPGQCDERYLLNVQHLTTHTSVKIDTTLCEGKTLEIGGVVCSRDTAIRTAGWIDDDTYADMDIRVSFSAPETEYDTVYVAAADMSQGYFYEDANQWIDAYGDYSYTITGRNRCTRLVELSVREQTPTAVADTRQPVPVSRICCTPDGTVYVVRGGKRYTLLGQYIK